MQGPASVPRQPVLDSYVCVLEWPYERLGDTLNLLEGDKTF